MAVRPLAVGGAVAAQGDIWYNLRVCVAFLFSHTHVDQSDDVSRLVIGGE